MVDEHHQRRSIPGLRPLQHLGLATRITEGRSGALAEEWVPIALHVALRSKSPSGYIDSSTRHATPKCRLSASLEVLLVPLHVEDLRL